MGYSVMSVCGTTVSAAPESMAIDITFHDAQSSILLSWLTTPIICASSVFTSEPPALSASASRLSTVHFSFMRLIFSVSSGFATVAKKIGAMFFSEFSPLEVSASASSVGNPMSPQTSGSSPQHFENALHSLRLC